MYNFRNCVYGDAANNVIIAEIEHIDYGWIPYSAMMGYEADMDEMFVAMQASNPKPYTPVYPDEPSLQEAEEALREVRNERLSQTDWTQLNDSPLKDNMDVLEYRKALREVPQHVDFPYNALPIPPSILNM